MTCQSKCLQCSFDNFCINYDDASCAAGQKVNIAGTACITCNVPNCERCISTGICDKCNDGYLINRATGQCNIPTNVISCGNANYCGVCTTAISTARIKTACQSCKDPTYKPRKNSDGSYPTCYPCNIPFCYYCSSSNSCS